MSIVPDKLSSWKKIDIGWMISHAIDSDISMWDGYHSIIQKDNTPLQKVSYLMPINASPTSNSVVWKTLKVAKKIANDCGCKYMQTTCDLAIAKVSCSIRSKEKPVLNDIFNHIGIFHIKCAFAKYLGTYIDGSGLINVLLDSAIIAAGSLNSFLSGKNYNRCKRIHLTIALALQKLHFQEFLEYENISIFNSVNSYLPNFFTIHFKLNRKIQIVHQENFSR